MKNSKWIPTTERLPDKAQEVLITSLDEEIYMAIWLCDCLDLNVFSIDWIGPGFYVWHDKHGKYYHEHTSAWQPLPEPYKKED